MRFEIRSRGVKFTEELRNHLDERLRLALERFGHHIDLVRVYLREVTGTRGCLGKVCRIVVELPPRGRVIVTGTDDDIQAAVTATAARAGFAVRRHVMRRRTRRRLTGRPERGARLRAA